MKDRILKRFHDEINALEKMLAEVDPGDTELVREVQYAIESLDAPEPEYNPEPLDIFKEYPKTDIPALDLLGEDDRIAMLSSPDTERVGPVPPGSCSRISTICRRPWRKPNLAPLWRWRSPVSHSRPALAAPTWRAARTAQIAARKRTARRPTAAPA